MATKKPFEIDIADLDAVRAKIPEVEQIVEEKREAVRIAQREFAYWSAVHERLHLLSGQSRLATALSVGNNKKPGEKTTNALDSIVKVLDESAVPLRAADLESRLPQFERKTLNWGLWMAAKQQRIQRIDVGLYASLHYQPHSDQERLLES